MPRPLRVASAQIGAIDRSTPRHAILSRLLALLTSAASQGVQLVVFPETTFTTFFPRYLIGDGELGDWFERDGFLEGRGVDGEGKGVEGEEEGENVLRTFVEEAGRLGVDVVVGYAESTEEIEALRRSSSTPILSEPGKYPQGYNTSIYISGSTSSGSALPPVLSKYRKVHLPGTFEPFNSDPKTTNQLEKRYFRPGNLGFKAFRAPGLKNNWEGEGKEERSPIVGMLICNDRRWAEGWRCYGLQGVEIMCIGYVSFLFCSLLCLREVMRRS